MDDIGWKSKLKIPPKDRRIRTSVSNKKYIPSFFHNVICYHKVLTALLLKGFYLDVENNAVNVFPVKQQ